MAKRIGLLTFHHVVNEGAILQTYALFKRLQELFPEDSVEVIDYRSLSAERGYRRQAFRGMRKPLALFNNASRFFNARRFMRKHLTLSGRSVTTDDYDRGLGFLRVGEYDLIVVGSDEIWKIESGAFPRPFPNVYWLGKDLGGMKVAYAASANKLPFRELNPGHQAWMAEALERFDLIGVRDDHTMDMLRHFKLPNLQNARKVPDPTFMLPTRDISMAPKLRKWGVDTGKPIVGITFGENALSGPLLADFRSRGYQTVAISAFNRFADFNLAGRLNPFEWAAIFGHFRFCFTSLFHGTIFSLKNNCPFLSFDNFSANQYETKLQCLLKEFDLADRYVSAQGHALSAGEIVDRALQVLERHDETRLTARVMRKKREADDFLGLVRGAL